MSETRSGISRRTLVKGTAWAIPAVAVANALPAAAASPCVTFTLGQASCKTPGVNHNFYYYLQLCVTSTCGGTIFPLTVTQIKTNNGSVITETPHDGPNTPGAPNTTATFTGSDCVFIDGYSHGSASTLTISYTTASGTSGTFELKAPPDTGGCTLPTTTTSTTAGPTTTTTTTAAPTTTTTTTVAP